jgi:hypothetical protein
MPENQSAEHERAAQILSRLEARSTEQLEQELAELMLAGSDSDEVLDLIDAYLAELEKRDPGKASISADDSLRDFHKKYDFLFPESSGDQHARSRRPRFRRSLLIAAVVVIMVSLLSVQVFGTNVFQVIADWTSETFGFHTSAPGETVSVSVSDSETYLSLQDALAAYHISPASIPQVLPEGYVQVELLVEEDGSSFTAAYQLGEDSFCISVSKLDTLTQQRIEKDAGDPELYSVGDIDIYIMENEGRYNAAWAMSEYEYAILGVSSKEVLYAMLNSIS